MRALMTVLIVLGSQLLAYRLFVHRFIMRWGATTAERYMSLPGDEPAPRTGGSTRAITIDASRSEVWAWLIQLGADRGGFYSYTLLENAMGYRFRGTGLFPQFQDLAVGRVIPASLEGAKPLVSFNFPVLAVEPGRYFVLGIWGTFWLEALDRGRTRLVVRTNGAPAQGELKRVCATAGAVMHYVMERRMLLGIKARAEAGAGVRLSEAPDNLWLAGLALSGLATALLAIVGVGLTGIALSVVLGVCWLLTLLLFPPRPAYSLVLLAAVALALAAAT